MKEEDVWGLILRRFKWIKNTLDGIFNNWKEDRRVWGAGEVQ